MLVTYKTFDKNGHQIDSKSKTHCFSYLFNSPWAYIELQIYEVPKTKGMSKFWLDLVKRIEPLLVINEDYTQITLPYLSSSKVLIILTIIRYLWENTNHYDTIVKLTKNIVDKYPDIDPLEAITMGASATTRGSGWGHSIVAGCAKHLVNIEMYNNYEGDTVHGLFNAGSYTLLNDLTIIRNEMTNEFDIEPVLKHFKYEEQRQSRAVTN